MKKAMLVGDSIRRGYQTRVEGLLEGVVGVCGPWENCRHSLWVLDHYDMWVSRHMANVVHANFGLHDVAVMADGEPQIVLEQYKLCLRRFIAKARDPLTTVIWATTTPAYVAQKDVPKDQWVKRPAVDEYNAAALEIVKAEGLQVNDLHAAVLANDYTRCLSDDGVHMTPFGYDVLAEAVAEAIRRAL